MEDVFNENKTKTITNKYQKLYNNKCSIVQRLLIRVNNDKEHLKNVLHK